MSRSIKKGPFVAPELIKRVEELNQTVTAHELEMAKMRDLMRLLTEKVKATQSSHIASQAEETPPPHY